MVVADQRVRWLGFKEVGEGDDEREMKMVSVCVCCFNTENHKDQFL
jgi:hypothetical protein